MKLDKGGFGLSESRRLWYLEYKSTLYDIGVDEELKLIPGMFRAFHPDGHLRALVCIHVDDTRYTGDDTAGQLWEELHNRLKFHTKEFNYSMADYIKEIPEVPQYVGNKEAKFEDGERIRLSSVLGQVNWAARQGRYDLSYGISHCQQMIGQGNKEAIDWTWKLLKRAQEPVEIKVAWMQPRGHQCA